jgi:hypothetical protein
LFGGCVGEPAGESVQRSGLDGGALDLLMLDLL